MIVKAAVVGCGQWGRNHVRTLAGMGALAAISDNDPDRAAALSAEHGVPALPLDDILQRPDIQAIVLALPPRLHAEIGQKILSAGKDVLIEKPIALAPADAEASVALAEDRGRVLMVGHVLRFHPVFEELVRQMEAGRIGTLRHIVATRLGLGRFLGMDAVWDLAPHDLSLVIALAGTYDVDMQALRQTVLSDETDVADLRLAFGNGVTAEIHVSRISPFRDRRLSAIGTEGMLTFDDLQPDGQKLAFWGHRVWREGDGFSFTQAEPEFLPTPAGLPLDAELRHFLHCVETRQTPRTGPQEAALVVRLLEQASPRQG